MEIEKIEYKETTIAVVSSKEKIIIDTQSALDLAMTVKYDASSRQIVIAKEAIIDDFFILSKGLAGEILQKYINYNIKMAIYGDFSIYTSKPLIDFMKESNKGHDFFFVATKEEAIEKLKSNS